MNATGGGRLHEYLVSLDRDQTRLANAADTLFSRACSYRKRGSELLLLAEAVRTDPNYRLNERDWVAVRWYGPSSFAHTAAMQRMIDTGREITGRYADPSCATNCRWPVFRGQPCPACPDYITYVAQVYHPPPSTSHRTSCSCTGGIRSQSRPSARCGDSTSRVGSASHGAHEQGDRMVEGDV